MPLGLPRGKPLILVQRGPYEDSRAKAAMDAAMSFAVFAQAPTVLFVGDGVHCLTDGQAPEGLGRKSVRKLIDSLPLYDVETLYVEARSWRALNRNNDALPAGAIPVDDASVARLCKDASLVLSF